MIDEVMFEIREMTGQTYKNVYAGQPTEAVEEHAPSRVATVADDRAADDTGERTLVSMAG